MMRPLWLALALARCTTMGELREKPPDLVLTSRHPPAAAIDCLQDAYDRLGAHTRRDVRPPMERLVVLAPILADIATEPDGTGSRMPAHRRLGPVAAQRGAGHRRPRGVRALTRAHADRRDVTCERAFRTGVYRNPHRILRAASRRSSRRSPSQARGDR
jgi:hypothetical protein